MFGQAERQISQKIGYPLCSEVGLKAGDVLCSSCHCAGGSLGDVMGGHSEPALD